MGRIIKIILLTLFALSLLSYCGKKGNKEASGISPSSNKLTPDYTIQEVTHYHYEDGILRVKITFERGEFYSSLNELYVENANFVYYDMKGKPLSRGSSKKAKVYQDRSELIAEDSVVVISDVNGGKLETEYLEWRGDENQFVSDKFVKITRTNGDTLGGVGLVADLALRYITIKKDVRGQFREKRDSI